FMLVSVTVTLVTGAVIPETLMTDGYGSDGPLVAVPAGMAIDAPMLNIEVDVEVAPTGIVNVAVPRSVGPSRSWNVAVITPPHIPGTGKVKGGGLAGPVGLSMP